MVRGDGRGTAGRQRREIGSPPSARNEPTALRRRAFTLLEILLALAVIGLLSAVLVSGATHLLGGRAMTPEEVFWEASRNARRTALKTGSEVRLSFDDKEKRFMADDGATKKEFALVDAPRELEVSFLPVRSTGGSILIGGQLVESEDLKSVTYYPDGTCMPFRVQFHATGPARVIAIDPWTCAPVLSDNEQP